MTMPAEVTSDNAWDRLTTVLRAMHRDADELYQRITEPETDEQTPQPEETETVSDVDAEHQTEAEALSVASNLISSLLYLRGQEPARSEAEADDRAAEYADEERARLDAETDGRLDGDYDTDAYDEPGLED
ncbi:hypothetical protein [Nucisporomicrobium flavum]|uniref:hypothetical protein n=1 Tax=Nucisporomicrobium flavum TaxID=2785915 RepID=UPI0018F34B17|nr:hypothetical protein [Nucisporomicrobium flavum]